MSNGISRRIGMCMGAMTNVTHMYDHCLMMTTLYTKGNSAQLLGTASLHVVTAESRIVVNPIIKSISGVRLRLN